VSVSGAKSIASTLATCRDTRRKKFGVRPCGGSFFGVEPHPSVTNEIVATGAQALQALMGLGARQAQLRQCRQGVFQARIEKIVDHSPTEAEPPPLTCRS